LKAAVAAGRRYDKDAVRGLSEIAVMLLFSDKTTIVDIVARHTPQAMSRVDILIPNPIGGR
jgi:hypothetical protein